MAAPEGMPASAPPRAACRRAVLRLLPKGGTGAEVGVFRGGFARRILDAARPRRLYLIDPWENTGEPELADARYAIGSGADMDRMHGDVCTRFGPQIASGQVAVLRQRSAEALAALPDNHLDFIYLDGDHRFASVAADLRLAQAKVRIGGMIALDDHVAGGWWGNGVVRAVAGFRAEQLDAVSLRLQLGDQIVLEKRAP